MAAGLGDLIQVVDNQTYLGEDLLNVYYYRITSLTGLNDTGLEAIADWFDTNVLDVIRVWQGSQLNHTVLSVRNLSNNIDYFEKVINEPGLVSQTLDNSLPSYATVNFKLIRESLVTRNGSKRYSGLQEARSSGNDYAWVPAEREATEEALAADIVLGLVTVAEPVIVKRPINPPVGTSYQYSSIGSALYTVFGTQNTRKP